MQRRLRPVAVYGGFLHRSAGAEYGFFAGEDLLREIAFFLADAIFPLNYRYLRGMYGAFAGEAVAQVFSHFLREEVGSVEVFEDGGGEEVACRFAEADQAVNQCAKRSGVEGDIRRGRRYPAGVALRSPDRFPVFPGSASGGKPCRAGRGNR